MNTKKIIEILKSMKLPALSEDAVSDAFGKIAFGDLNRDSKYVIKLAKLQSKTLPKPDGELNTDDENHLYFILKQWTDRVTPSLAKQLYAFKDLIVKAQKKFPEIFKPLTPNKTIVYRGLEVVSDKLVAQIKNTDIRSWKKISLPRGDFYVYQYPIKYSPRQLVQSWSTVLRSAAGFAEEGMLISTQNSDFLINSNLFKILYDGNENEILHFGKDYTNKVYIALTSYAFNEIFEEVPTQKISSKALASVIK